MGPLGSVPALEAPGDDASLLSRGRRIESRYRLSWWGSLVVAAAQTQACTLLISEDFQDGMRFDRLTVRDPFRLSVEEAAGQYGESSR